MAKSWSHALLWASLAGALTGCGTVPDRPENAQPINPSLDADLGSAEPVPQFEPPSRSGNPDTYVVFGRRYRVRESSQGYRQEGVASWYGWDFHGRKTSSGPLFNMFELTAAHKSLPLPTYVRVTNLENGRNIVVKVTDRGPFVGERLIDLSYAAAARLDMLEQGTARVEVAALEPYQFLPDLAARRADLRERLASRVVKPAPRAELATIQFARERPATSMERQRVRLAAATATRNPPQSSKQAPSAAKTGGREKSAANIRLAAAAPAIQDKGRARASQDKGRAPERRAVATGKHGALYLVGTVTERSGPQHLRNRLTSQLQRNVQVESSTGSRYEVRVPLRNPNEARQVAVRLASLGVSQSRIVAD